MTIRVSTYLHDAHGRRTGRVDLTTGILYDVRLVDGGAYRGALREARPGAVTFLLADEVWMTFATSELAAVERVRGV